MGKKREGIAGLIGGMMPPPATLTRTLGTLIAIVGMTNAAIGGSGTNKSGRGIGYRGSIGGSIGGSHPGQVLHHQA